MRCYICDAPLSNDEIRFNRMHGDFDPCNTCREVISRTARETRDPEEKDDGDDMHEWDELLDQLGLSVEESELADD